MTRRLIYLLNTPADELRSVEDLRAHWCIKMGIVVGFAAMIAAIVSF